ncbi:MULTISPECIES: DUF4148 domain-containing protein [Burkholderia cepacia complex]|uniref:Purine nucleoside phosphorylase n=1 Tax=Burkholderia orbicola (strain MC0-3) TaxID=406425 RepID=B1K9Z5_BURO0|nr:MULTISPECIES: DUF4148 domain-containing protein [Burkholderia cepacia complex]SDR57128.1 protein of unknown function [Burkholderia orbicola]ACA96095.1 conserved hypothetical protein [Burkholderia orbicola MC0-3]KOR18910.1 purine nucleoside phosphorylase [Burkholderia cenocepacia]MBR7984063.1 DUF4148 domain-containing protein [Burkholderia cenocepacia]MBR8158037.1 DUF4148 domain-containing protein [Burkholderia cenocepacia]
MNNLIRAVLLSCALSAPIVAFAQTTDHAVTRADVRADLVRVEKAGYRPVGSDPYYPEDIQAAEAKVVAQQAQSAAARPSVAAKTAAPSFASLASLDTQPLYEHH